MIIDWDSAWKVVRDAIVSFGWAKGTLTIFFWVAHYWIFREYRGRLRDRQNEIDRIAADNREYRDRFTNLLDQYFKPPQQLIEKREPPKSKKGKNERH